MLSEEPSFLRNACLVAAHPDDEILWFSALARRVDRIFLCYLGNPAHPKLGRGRAVALGQAPLTDFVCLGLDEADVYDLARWPDPDPTPAGVALAKARHGASERRYRDNFARLAAELGQRLRGFDTVFTHNPWGEYGHEEHVQVYRAVRAVQPGLGFDLWCSAYGGSRSAGLMARCLQGAGIESFSLDTDQALAREVAERYKAAGVWTWFEDYIWPERESFLRLTPGARPPKTVPAVPLNYLDLGLPVPGLADRSLRGIVRKARQFWPLSARPPVSHL